MARVHGVECDRCAEVLYASSRSEVDAMLIRHGWTVVQLSARKHLFLCELCEAVVEAKRAKIMRDLGFVSEEVGA